MCFAQVGDCRQLCAILFIKLKMKGTALWGTSLQQHWTLTGVHGVGEAKLCYLGGGGREKGTHKLS